MMKNLVIAILSAIYIYDLSIWEVKNIWLLLGLVFFMECFVQSLDWHLQERKTGRKRK